MNVADKIIERCANFTRREMLNEIGLMGGEIFDTDETGTLYVLDDSDIVEKDGQLFTC